ncbi:MAG: hypothetical protein OEL88_00010 [Sterolibacteriaceae bacterium MAG5]|nr:hypothetical protein [Candidatus Nitricoxidireducens bremensis]
MPRNPRPQRPLKPMDAILFDDKTRQSFYDIYRALFKAHKNCPDAFKDNNLTRIMTGLRKA